MDIEYYKNIFLNRLKEQMNGKSITAFSRQIGVSARKVCNWLRKKTFPKLKDLILIAENLGIRINYLIGLED